MRRPTETAKPSSSVEWISSERGAEGILPLDEVGPDGSGGENGEALESSLMDSSWIDVTEEERLVFEANLEEFPGMRMFFFKGDGSYASYISNSGFGETGSWRVEGDTVLISGEAGTEMDEWEISMSLRIDRIDEFGLSGGFLREGASDVSVEFRRLDNPLAKAAESGLISELERIASEKRDIDTPLFGGLRALMYAAFHNQSEALVWLLDHGADPDSLDMKGESALHFAAKAGNTGIAGVLLERGADPSIESEFGHAPAALAEVSGHDGTKSLIERKLIDLMDNAVR